MKSLVIDMGLEPIFILDSNDQVIFANSASTDLFGFEDSRELIGKNWKSFFSEQNLESIQSEISEKMSASDQWRFESSGKRKNGALFECEVSISRVSTGGMIWVIRDITASRRAEITERVLNLVSTQVPTSLNFLKTIESLVEVIISTGLADWSVVYIVESEELTSRVVAMNRDPAHAENMQKLSEFVAPKLERDSPADKLLRSGKSVLISEFGEENFKRFATSPEHEKTLRTIGMSSAVMVPLFISEKFVGGVSFVRSQANLLYSQEDVSLAEELVRRASISIENAMLYEKAQNAVIARNDFVAMVSHDLKNPLSAILLNTAFIKRGFTREKNLTEKEEGFKRQIEAMERSAQRMNSLICDFLDLSRIESGRLAIDRQLYRLQTLMRDTLEMLQPLASAKSIELSALVLKDLPDTGFFDRERIFQVLSNLIGNAIKFTPERGKIELSLIYERGSLVFSVKDSGPGLSKQQLPHVFDRYWQAKENLRSGSGLGLNIAKGIVESHNGRIWVESETGQGSTFHFSIPQPLN